MNRSELIERLSERAKLSPSQSEEVVDMVFENIRKYLINGDRVEIRGFGSFVVKEYKARKGRNPKTGEVIDCSAKRLPHFKLGKELKERLNS